MTGSEALIWGLFGGASVEALDFYRIARSPGQRKKVAVRLGGLAALLASVVFRVGVGGGLALAAFQEGQVAGAMGAVAIGIGAPLAVAQLSRSIPVEVAASGAPPDASPFEEGEGGGTPPRGA